MQSKIPTCRNPNHPKSGSQIKAEPIRSRRDIRKIKKLLADNPRDLCLFTLGINTAYRSSELVSIKVGQVSHLKSWDRLELKQSKNNRYRAVTLNRAVVRSIRKWLAVHPRPTPETPLFISRTSGEALKSNTVTKYVKSWCEQTGLDGNYGSHSLRKTWGYHIYRGRRLVGLLFFRRRGSNIAELMLAFGHASQRQTLQYLCIEEHDIALLYRQEL